MKKGLVIAGRYAAIRRQFGPNSRKKGSNPSLEYPIIEYQTSQYRLIPALADLFAFRFTNFNMYKRSVGLRAKVYFLLS